MCDPMLEYKRQEVTKRAAISTPLAALTEEEKRHYMVMVERIFTGYDKDGSGKLEFGEFRACLKESQLGLSEKQISYLMSLSDADDSGAIDYNEFIVLFFESLVELARMEMIERELSAGKASSIAHMLLDPSYLAIPLRIGFDLAADGGEEVPPEAFATMLEQKAWGEWGLGDGIAPILRALRGMETLTWEALCALLLTFIPSDVEEASELPPPPEAEAKEAEAEALPTGE